VSTHTTRTTEPEPNTETRTEPSPAETAPRTTLSADDGADRTHDDLPGSWVARCQSQFDAGHRDRLRNLADDANHAMPDGV